MKRLSEFYSLILDLTPYQWDNSGVMEVPFNSDYLLKLLDYQILYIKISGSALELPITYFPAKIHVSATSESITGYTAEYSYGEVIVNGNDPLSYRLTFFYKEGANAKFLLEEI